MCPEQIAAEWGPGGKEFAMNRPEFYGEDLLFFFDGKPRERSLYEALQGKMEAEFPECSVKVQKTQISFYGRRLFAAVSLPRSRKSFPEHSILVTLGLPYKLESPRAAVTVEPYPGRWTNHVPLWAEEQIDRELLTWLREAYAFSESKR